MDMFGCLLMLFYGTAGRSLYFPSILQGGRRLGWPRRVGGVLASAYESSFGAFGCAALTCSAVTDRLNLLYTTM